MLADLLEELADEPFRRPVSQPDLPALAGRIGEAHSYLAAIHKAQSCYGVDDLITAMQFDSHGAALFRKGARLIGTQSARRSGN